MSLKLDEPETVIPVPNRFVFDGPVQYMPNYLSNNGGFSPTQSTSVLTAWEDAVQPADEICRICGVFIRTMCFKGTKVCCTNHWKEAYGNAKFGDSPWLKDTEPESQDDDEDEDWNL